MALIYETFSTVIKPQLICAVLDLALSNNWHIHQLEVNNAFIHGHLNEPVQIKEPPRFIHPDYPNHVCRLKKAINELKQAPQAWFRHFSNALIFISFLPSKADTSLFVYQSSYVNSFLLLYVDDIVICSNCSDTLH